MTRILKDIPTQTIAMADDPRQSTRLPKRQRLMEEISSWGTAVPTRTKVPRGSVSPIY